MKRGVVLVAHNGAHDYVAQATATAARVHRFLDLPVTLISDSDSIKDRNTDVFDTVVTTTIPGRNLRSRDTPWLNKGRHRVYELSPYDHTLVLDTDYLINSSKLLQTFTQSQFQCHAHCRWLLQQDIQTELLGKYRQPIMWATVMCFTRDSHTQQVFELMNMIQDNYVHYSHIYGFNPAPYRNDYALTIALKTACGHASTHIHHIPWSLCHAGADVTVEQEGDTQFTLRHTDVDGRKHWIRVRDMDFHMLDKTNFARIV